MTVKGKHIVHLNRLTTLKVDILRQVLLSRIHNQQ